MLAGRRVLLDSAETAAACAEEMSECLATKREHRDTGIRALLREGDPGAARASHDPLHDPAAAG